MNAGSKKLKYYDQSEVKDPYGQISNNGFTPLGNLKTYAVANMYDRPEPTHLRDLPDLFTVPYSTTPFLGSNQPSIKYVNTDSEVLRAPVFNHKKSAIDVSQVTFFPQQVFKENPNVSKKLNLFYEQETTINNGDDVYGNGSPQDDKVKLGQIDDGQNVKRVVNRWNYVDPRIVQNVDNIIMNMKSENGIDISLPRGGVSTRNELRNYVEYNKC